MIPGGCFCGRVRTEARGTPFNATRCHCASCRKVAGTPLVAWFSCRPDELVLVAGAPRTFASSDGVTRGATQHRHRVGWIDTIAGLPAFSAARGPS